MIRDVLREWADVVGDDAVPAAVGLDFVYEALGNRRRDERFGRGVTLQTVHGAKGCEYPHVLLCGDWSKGNRQSLEEERRVFYVGMTRARETLSIFVRSDLPHPFAAELSGTPFAVRQESTKAAERREEYQYHTLGMADLFMDFAGWRRPGDPVHAALAALTPGDRVSLALAGERIEVRTVAGAVIGQLSKQGSRSGRADWAQSAT